MTVFQMSLAFNWKVPASLLFGFSRFEDGLLKPIEIDGKSLSQGGFLIEPFAKTRDAFTFQLYEWVEPGVRPDSIHAKPNILRVHADNFESRTLFTNSVIFSKDQILDTPQRVDSALSPFPGLSDIYSWIAEPFVHQLFPITELSEQQTFRLSSRVVVPAHSKSVNRTIRSFYFDPEMIVGDDGGSSPIQGP